MAPNVIRVGTQKTTIHFPSCMCSKLWQEVMVMAAERRQFTRCNSEQGDFYVFSHEEGIIGKLRNIGPKGAAYEYTPFSGQAAEDTWIDITAADPNGYHIRNIACRKVYDVNELTVDEKFSESEKRLCGVRFVHLSEEQEDKLHFLLEDCFINAAAISCF